MFAKLKARCRASQAAEKLVGTVILSMDSRKRLSMLRMTAGKRFSAACEARRYESHRVPGFSPRL
jgi:hypothetical protein